MNISVVTLEQGQDITANSDADGPDLNIPGSTIFTIKKDLDAERRHLNIPGSTNLRLKNVDEKLSTRCLQKVNEDQEQNSPEIHPNHTEHMKAFDKILEYYCFCGRVLGLKIKLQFNWQEYLGFWLILCALFSTWTCMAYTVYIHYVNENFVRILEPLAISGITIVITQKIYVWLTYYDDIVALSLDLSFVCRRTIEDSSRANVLKTGLKKTLRLMKGFTLGIIFSTFVYFVMPLKVLLIDKEWMYMIPMEVLFCDQSTWSGFLVANIIQAIMALYAINATIVFDLNFIILICSYNLTVDLVAEDFQDLDKMWNGTIDSSVAYRHAFLRNICQKRQDMNCYLNWTKKIWETKLFYYICTNYFSQIICLYQIAINNWQGGYGTFFGFFVETMFYCYMGSSIAISNDRICDIIYGTAWYEYDLTSQRIILLLLKEAQMERDLLLGVIGPLNLVTFVKVVKSIYSYYTVLTEVL